MWFSRCLSTDSRDHHREDQEGSERLLGDGKSQLGDSKQRPSSAILWLVVHISLLLLAAIFFISTSYRLETRCPASSAHRYRYRQSPHRPRSKANTGLALLDNSIREAPKQFQGDFDHTSVFKGSPRPELDEAWDDISNVGVISIQESVFPLLNKSAARAATVPLAQGDAYVASVEVFHQLHCLVCTPHSQAFRVLTKGRT